MSLTSKFRALESVCTKAGKASCEKFCRSRVSNAGTSSPLSFSVSEDVNVPKRMTVRVCVSARAIYQDTVIASLGKHGCRWVSLTFIQKLREGKASE